MYFAHVLKPGTILNNKYRIESVIGEGGFGIVYCAYDMLIGEKIAIKEFFPSTLGTRSVTEQKDYSVSVLSPEHKASYEKSLGRFREEASKLAKFNKEPGIVSVKNYFEENNTGYIVMDFIEGITLEQYLNEKGGKISCEEAISLLIPMIDSLDTVHKAGIIHRDISPDNIMVTDSGRAILIDFGASRAFESEEEQAFTVMIKNGYAPVEQYSMMSEQTPATDVYAIAAVLYRMITGQKPDNSSERILAGNKYINISECPVYVEKAINQGMKTDAKDRCRNLSSFKRLLLKKQKTYFALMAAMITLIVLLGVGIIYRNLPTEEVSSFYAEDVQEKNISENTGMSENNMPEDTAKHFMYTVAYSDVYVSVWEKLVIADHCKPGDIYEVIGFEGDYALVVISEYQTGYIHIDDIVEEDDYNEWISFYHRVVEASGAITSDSEMQNLQGIYCDFDGTGSKELITPVYTGSGGLWYADATSVYKITDEIPYCYENFQQGKYVFFCATNRNGEDLNTKYYFVNNGTVSEIQCNGYNLSFEKGWMTASENGTYCENDIEYIDKLGNEKKIKLLSTEYWPVVVVNGRIGECASTKITLEEFMEIPSSERLLESISENLNFALRNHSMDRKLLLTSGYSKCAYFAELTDYSIDSVFFNEQGFFIINILADIDDVDVEYYGADGYTTIGYYHIDKVYAHIIVKFEGDGTLQYFDNFSELEQALFYGKVQECSNKWPVLMNSDFSHYRGNK